MHPAQYGFIGAADLANIFQLCVAETVGCMAKTTHQCRTLPFARVLRFTDPGALAIVTQCRCIGIEPLRMADALLAGDRVVQHFEVLIVQAQDAPALMLVDTLSIRLGVRCKCYIGSLVRGQVGVPQTCLAVGQLHWLESLEKR
ncbi:hypothetical protein D3C81_902400 [compost metagenome]